MMGSVIPHFQHFKNLRSIKNINERYELDKEDKLGQGSFGLVIRATSKISGKDCAMKIIKKKNISSQVEEELMANELNLLKDLSHPNIMEVTEILHDKNHWYIAMEVLEGGELFDRISEKDTYTEADVVNIIKQVLEACNYMHQKNVVHRDLKPQNVMMKAKDSFDNIKITDLGFACTYDPKQGLNLRLGTPYYMAPELFKKQKYNSKVDIWSIGVIAFQLMTGDLPFIG